jgi:DNA-directed RNA polymerase specialized sigma24 family protein
VKTEVEEEHIKTGLLLGTEQEKEDAIRDAYERYKRPLFGFIKETVAPTLDSDEIESAIHDVFCGLAKYVSRGKFKRDGSLKTLLFTMARRKGYDQLRRKTKGWQASEPEIMTDCGDDEQHPDGLEDELTIIVAQKLRQAPEISAVWKNAADEAATNEIMRQFRMWIATGNLHRVQRKVAENIALYVGDISDAQICDEIAKTGEQRPTVASVKSARKEIIRKFGSLMQRQERTTKP